MRNQGQDQFQLPQGLPDSGSLNPAVINGWTSQLELQQQGVLLPREARTPDSPELVSAHDRLNGVLEAMGKAPILTVKAEYINPDSAEVLPIDATLRDRRDRKVRSLTEVA